MLFVSMYLVELALYTCLLEERLRSGIRISSSTNRNRQIPAGQGRGYKFSGICKWTHPATSKTVSIRAAANDFVVDHKCGLDI